LRYRIEHSRLLARILARLVGSYLRLCQITTRWTIVGLDDLRADLNNGPVLVVMWHERSLMGPLHWPKADGPLSTLYASSPIGRVSGAMQRQIGLRPMEMADGQSNVAAARIILRRVRDGVSIGMTGDGPLGPALHMKDAPLDWARASGRPVHAYGFAAKRHRRLGSWDRMLMPLPFTSGAIVFRRWQEQPPRKADPEKLAALRDSFGALLSDTMAEADRITFGKTRD